MLRELIRTLCLINMALTRNLLAGPPLDVHTVIIWSPSERPFFASKINRTLHEDLKSAQNVTILEDNHINTYLGDAYRTPSTSWTVFLDLREYACPGDVFQEHVLAYISVTQLSCPLLSGVSQKVFVRVDSRTFDRGAVVADLTNSTHKSTSTLALLFDDTGEEHFYGRRFTGRLPLVFEIGVALDNCDATEQLKNLTAKTEIRDVLVVARAHCITELLTEAKRLQLLFGRYRWLLYPTDQSLPHCSHCQHLNGVIFKEKLRPKDNPPNTPEKLLQFVDKSISEFINSLTPDELDICNNCTKDNCPSCTVKMPSAMTKVERQDVMIFFTDNATVRDEIIFDLLLVTSNSSYKIGEWSESGGLDSPHIDLFPHSTGDIVLRVVVVVEPPFVFHRETENGSEFVGYSLDVLKRISESVGFSYVVRQCDNNDYGASTEKGQWSGCIGNVMRGEADVVVGALTVTAEREEVVDFTLPYYDFAGIQILIKKHNTDVNLFYFVDVFTTEAWICLFGVIALTSVLLYIFERFTPKKNTTKGDGGETPHAFDLKESIWFVIGSVTLAGGGEPPRSLASRLLVAGFWFFSVVIMSTFTANLAAFLTVSRMGTTIASLDELAAQSDVKYSVVRESNVKAYFEHQAAIERNFYELWKNMSLGGSGNIISDQNLAVWDYPLGDKFGNMWSSIVKTGLLNSTQDGLDRVLKGNFALITESPVIKYLTSKYCTLASVGEQFSVRPYAFALKDKSLFTSKFTTAILQLQKQRELENLKRKWWDDAKLTCPANTRDKGLDLGSLTGTFIVMGGGLCLGLIALVVEYLLSKRNKEQGQIKEMTAEKDTDGRKAIATVDSSHLHNSATLDQLIMARELKHKLELQRAA